MFGCNLKVVGNEKGGGSGLGRLATVRRCFRTVAIDVCLLFNVAVVFYSNRKWKYFEEKTTTTLKSKQTSIATVRKHLRIVASLPTPLPFSLPTTFKTSWLDRNNTENLFSEYELVVCTNRLAYIPLPMHGMSKRAMGLLKLILGLAGLVFTIGLGILLILTPAQASFVPLSPNLMCSNLG
jgi:hypothetical protein